MASRVVSTLNCGRIRTNCLSEKGMVFQITAGSHNQYFTSQRIVSICSNATCTLCLDECGNAEFFIGGNPSIPLVLPPIKQISCGEDFFVLVSEEGNVYSFGNNDYHQLGQNLGFGVRLIPGLKDVDFVECGSFFFYL